MILVQNRLQRLNGNKIWILIFGCLLTLNACNSSKVLNIPKKDQKDEPVEELDPITGKNDQNKRSDEPSDGEDYTVESNDDDIIDTYKSDTSKEVVIHTIDSTNIDIAPNETNDIPVGDDDKDIYNVCLSLPFYNNTHDLNKSNWALNYYTGVELGMTYLEGMTAGNNVDIKVFDSKSDDVKYELTNAIADYDLIIGPASKNNVKVASGIAKQKKIPFVSIYQTAQSLVEENPYYIQMRSSLKSHCEKLMAEAMHQYKGKNIVLVAPNDTKNIAAFSYLQDYYKLHVADSLASPLKEVIIDLDEETNVLKEDVFDNVLTELSTRKVFIVLAWKRENFILETLKLINAKKQLAEVSVLGFPQWLNSVDKSIDLFRSLNVKISTNYYLDPYNIEVRNFKKAYYARYGSMPANEAFEGYATIIYFVRGLSNYGKGFINHLNDLENPPFMTYDFEKIPLQNMNEDFSKFRLIENRGIKMLSFNEGIITQD